ncbi:hypothetical protein ACVWWK_005043 [Bradyrhizobium sp. LB9.1b]
MPEHKYLHVSFNFEGREPPTAQIKGVLNKAVDWVNYAPNCWMIYTSTTSAATWYARLRKVVDNDDSIFVCELNLDNRQGWLPQNVWDWIHKDR